MASILSKLDLKMHLCQVYKIAWKNFKYMFPHKLFQALSSKY